MIRNNRELAATVARVDSDLQDIQDYMVANPKANGRVRFPRGFIHTASYYRRDLWFLDEAHRRNISYSLQSLDILKWIANRTDLSGPAKMLLNRSGVVIIGSITEDVAVFGTDDYIGRSSRFRRRLERMRDEFGMINNTQVGELEELWDRRNSIHIGAVATAHIDLYNVRDVNKSFRVMKELIKSLDKWHYDRIPF